MRALAPVLSLALCVGLCQPEGRPVSGRQYGAAGLFTDPAMLERPVGAMDEALDVVIRRPGMVEPRPKFGSTGDGANLVTARDLHAFDGDVFINNGGGAKWISTTGTTINDDEGSQVNVESFSQAEARGNLYVSSDICLVKATGGGETTMQRCTPPSPPVLTTFSAATTGILDTQSAFSYRVTWERTDSNRVTNVSMPTGAHVFCNPDVSNTYAPTFFVRTEDYAEGDVIRVYRTYMVSHTSGTPGFPSDEHFEIKAHTLNSSDISSGGWSFTDEVEEASNNFGAPLYTNPSRGSFANANFSHPAADAHAHYKGSLFGGSTRSPSQITLYAPIGGVLTGTAEGVGLRGATANATLDDADLTSVSNTTGLKVGMIVERTDGLHPWSGQVVITEIDGSTVTVSATSTVNLTGANFVFHDALYIDGDYHKISDLAQLALSTVTVAGNTTPGPTNYRPIVSGVALRYDVTTGYGLPFQTAFILRNRFNSVVGGSGVAIRATHGSEYSPPLSEPGTADVKTYQDVEPAALWWSKFEQPEHVRLSDKLIIGSGEAQIRSLVVAGDSMWIFKDDGVFRLRGASERTGWSVNQVSASHKSLGYGYACELAGSAYAWTTQGIVRVDQRGIVNIDEPIQNLLKAHQDAVGVGGAISGACWSDPSANEVYFADYTAQRIYVYNTRTRAWTRWTTPGDASGHVRDGVWEPEEGVLYLATTAGATDGVWKEGAAEEADVTCKVKWSDFADDPGLQTRFLSVTPVFESRDGVTSYDLVFDSSTDGTTDTITRSYTPGAQAGAMRCTVPRDHAWAQRLGLQIELQGYDNGTDTLHQWQLAGVRFESEPIGVRTRVR